MSKITPRRAAVWMAITLLGTSMAASASAGPVDLSRYDVTSKNATVSKMLNDATPGGKRPPGSYYNPAGNGKSDKGLRPPASYYNPNGRSAGHRPPWSYWRYRHYRPHF